MNSALRQGFAIFGAFAGAVISLRETMFLEYICRISGTSQCLATFTPWRYTLTAVATGLICWAVVYYGLLMTLHTVHHVRKHLGRKHQISSTK